MAGAGGRTPLTRHAVSAIMAAGGTMKLFVGFLMFFWLICGFAGAWRLDGVDDLRWKKVARGPITLVRAFNEKPVTYPGSV